LGGDEADLRHYFEDEFEGVDCGASDQFHLYPPSVPGVVWECGGVVVELLFVAVGGRGRGGGREGVVDCVGAEELLKGLGEEEAPWVC